MKTILIATIFVLVVIPIVIVFRRKKLSPKVANTVKKALNNLVPDEADPVSEDFGQPVQSVTDTDEGKADKFKKPGTIATGDLVVKQLLPNGKVYKEHSLMENQIVPDGVSVSHPGAVTEGLCLTGVENEFHQFDMSEGSATYIAMTVPTDAIFIGKDADGYYAGDEDMTVAYAYLLACKKEYKKAFSVLALLKDNGNPKATGMYGIISGYEKTEKNDGLSKEDVGMILASAEKGFSVAEYYIGRWYLSGTYGFAKDIEKGLSYLFDSFNKKYLPAAIYLKKAMKRHPESFKNTSEMERLLDIVCDSLNKKDGDIYPNEMFRAIVLSPIDAPEGAAPGGRHFLS